MFKPGQLVKVARRVWCSSNTIKGYLNDSNVGIIIPENSIVMFLSERATPEDTSPQLIYYSIIYLNNVLTLNSISTRLEKLNEKE